MKRWVDERLLGNFAFALRAIVEPPLSRLFYRSAHSLGNPAKPTA